MSTVWDTVSYSPFPPPPSSAVEDGKTICKTYIKRYINHHIKQKIISHGDKSNAKPRIVQWIDLSAVEATARLDANPTAPSLCRKSSKPIASRLCRDSSKTTAPRLCRISGRLTAFPTRPSSPMSTRKCWGMLGI